MNSWNQHYRALGHSGVPPKGGSPLLRLAPRTADMGSSNPPLAGAVSERQSAKGRRAAPWIPAPRVAEPTPLADARRATAHDPSQPESVSPDFVPDWPSTSSSTTSAASDQVGALRIKDHVGRLREKHTHEPPCGLSLREAPFFPASSRTAHRPSILEDLCTACC